LCYRREKQQSLHSEHNVDSRYYRGFELPTTTSSKDNDSKQGDNGADGIVSTSDFANFLKQKVDMDEVNAAIIKSLLEEKEDELEEGMNHN